MADPNRCSTLIGRHDQLHAVVDALAGDRQHGALVVAPAGMGKTVLLRAVMAAEAERFAFFPLTAGAAAGLAVPFGALTPLLAELPAGSGQQVRDVLGTVRGFIRRNTGTGRRTVVVADDADALDVGSASVIARLAASGEAKILASARPGAGPAVSALYGVLRRVELGPLAPEQREEFCRAVLQAEVLPSGIRMLTEASGGSPRTLGFLLEEARRVGCLVRRNNTWAVLGEPPDCSRPLLEATRQELSRLGEAQQTGLQMLALAGSLKYGDAEELVCPATIDALVPAGYVRILPVPEGGRGITLAAAMHGESLRQLAPVGLKRQVYRWFAAHQGQLAGEQRLLAARWALESGEPVPAGQLLAAAEAANSGFRPGTALQLAAAPGGGDAGPAAAVQLARAHLYLGHFTAARSLIWPVLQAAGDPETAAAAAGTAVELARYQGQGQAALEEVAGGWEESLRRLHRAGNTAACTGPQLLRLQARLAGGHLDGTSGELERLLANCPEQGLRVQALLLLAETQSVRGRGLQGTATALQALELIDAGARCGPVPQVQLHVRLARVLIHNGELEAAVRRLEVLDLAEARAMLVFGGTVDFLRAMLSLKRGHVRPALGILATAVEGLRRCDPEQLLPYALGRAAAANAVAGDRNEAGRLAAESAELALAGPVETCLLAQAYAVRAGAMFDSTKAAVDRLAEIAGSLAGAGMLAAELEVRMLMIRLGDRGRLEEMMRCAGAVEGREAELCLDLAQALRSRSGRQALSTAEKAAASGYLMIAAEAAAHSVRQFAGEANHAQARAAGRFLQKLRRQLPELQGPQAPAGRQLTYRERDVATLAARGIPNREIAVRLGLSVRTVEGHIYRIYEKLDICSREELAASAGQDFDRKAAAALPRVTRK